MVYSVFPWLCSVELSFREDEREAELSHSAIQRSGAGGSLASLDTSLPLSTEFL